MVAILDKLMGKTKPAKPIAAAQPPATRARYDAAQTTDANRGYWSGADGYSARLANSPGVRKILRERSRYEWANNCYAKGMLRTDADYIVGTGPRLQLLTDDDDYNREVERKFHLHAREIRFARKLWTARLAWIRDGEGFLQFYDNRALNSPVKLDLLGVECDQIADSAGQSMLSVKNDDGLVLDDFGNVVAYKKWPYHPGDIAGVMGEQPELVPARYMLHLFRRERPGQFRGVPEITPALMLYPTMRRWTYAALGAAEKAARIAGVLKSTYDVQDATQLESFMDVYLEADSFLTLPAGWDMNQVRSEQPPATYEMFKRQVVSEIARCLNMPFNIAAADSSDYNFASGKLDHLGWYKSVSIDQSQLDDDAATPYFRAWFYEADRLDSFLPPLPGEFDDGIPPHTWFWDGQDTIDPREATAKMTGLMSGCETLPRIWAKKGLDWEQEFRAQAKCLGMTLEEYQASVRDQLFKQPPQAAADTGGQDDEPQSKKQSRSVA